MTDTARQKVLEAYFGQRCTMREAALAAGVPAETATEAILDELTANIPNIRPRGRHPESVIRAFYEVYAACGSAQEAAKRVGVPVTTARKWLRPEMTPVDATLRRPEVEDALMQNALRALARDDQRDAELSDARATIAQDLYQKARHFWNRAKEKADAEPIPHNELKALVQAAHYAVKDAQLLGGQPTERVESLIRELENLSDEELQAIVYGDEYEG